MGVFRDLADLICDYADYKAEEEIRIDREIKAKRDREERERERLKREREEEIRNELFIEEQKNPDEFRVLPYGWSPFGFRL